MGFQYELIQEVSAEHIDDSCYRKEINLDESKHEDIKPQLVVTQEPNISTEEIKITLNAPKPKFINRACIVSPCYRHRPTSAPRTASRPMPLSPERRPSVQNRIVHRKTVEEKKDVSATVRITKMLEKESLPK